MKELEDLLKSINSGKKASAQRQLAKLLGVSDTSVSNWFSKNKKPSEDNISKMAKIFNTSEKELKKIFDLHSSNIIIGDKNQQKIETNKEIEILKEKNKLLEERIKVLEEQVLFYKEKSKK